MMTSLTNSAARIARLSSSALGLALLLSAVAAPAAAGFDTAPEVDPGSLASAMTLLVGGVLTLTGRVRRGR